MFLLVVLLIVVFVAAACGDDDDGGGGQPATSSESDGGETTPGLDPEVVEQFQTQLAAIGCYDGPIDGVDGPETTAAIVNFQRAQGLGEDGVVGPETEAALETAVEAGVQGCSADGE
jgi:peptidoglycan hydrolase-like protein with peptidoglycan-binding domain